eukprot:NODE_14234_length_1120_cov_8.611279.p1 GENE.NODE_14234_length_1120_cov_8.611279~~NODE_14234_length_1120_cov_8.611279.p1  ORF type:complete len:182 (-),score=16.67 NODE_14234_length_1120_cov_8.611279:60-605(-)
MHCAMCGFASRNPCGFSVLRLAVTCRSLIHPDAASAPLYLGWPTELELPSRCGAAPSATRVIASAASRTLPEPCEALPEASRVGGIGIALLLDSARHHRCRLHSSGVGAALVVGGRWRILRWWPPAVAALAAPAATSRPQLPLALSYSGLTSTAAVELVPTCLRWQHQQRRRSQAYTNGQR